MVWVLICWGCSGYSGSDYIIWHAVICVGMGCLGLCAVSRNWRSVPR